MAKLELSVAVRDYDRARPLVDGEVPIDGVDPVFMTLSPEEIFFRAFRHAEFDICELSLSSYCVKIAGGDCPYVGVPVFISRAFRHNSIYVRTDRIRSPGDLKGRRIGVPEYQLTCVGARPAGGRPWGETFGPHLGARRPRGSRAAGKNRHQLTGGCAARAGT
jgi:4,5-dihydroxyphthalate decarboxylase